jgi:hypothetical protein
MKHDVLRFKVKMYDLLATSIQIIKGLEYLKHNGLDLLLGYGMFKF